jgi:uncharacterized protein
VKRISIPISIILAAILVALLAVVVATTALAAPPAQGTQPDSESQAPCTANRTVQVSGSAVVNVVPDRASIQLGVQSNGVTVGEVEQANSAAIQRVLKALRGLGIEEKDIATDRYIIEPVYENYDSLRIRGYRINNMVAVTLRDVSQTSPAIAAALQAGANQVVDVSFYTSQLRQYRDQARSLAMKAAGEKAGALAQAAGAQTGSVLTISENSWSYFNGMWGGRSSSQMTQNVVQNIAPTGAGGSTKEDEPISLGQISVHAEVSVTYCMQ